MVVLGGTYDSGVCSGPLSFRFETLRLEQRGPGPELDNFGGVISW